MSKEEPGQSVKFRALTSSSPTMEDDLSTKVRSKVEEDASTEDRSTVEEDLLARLELQSAIVEKEPEK